MSQKFYRAKLSLEELERHTDSNGYPQVRGMEIARLDLTGDTPADALIQLCTHADSLCDWHSSQADDGGTSGHTVTVDVGPLHDLFKRIRARRRTEEDERAAEANQDGADDEGEPRCLLRDDNRNRCTLPARHEGDCDYFGVMAKPTSWCGDPDHDDPCERCDTILADASDALRQRMPTARSSHAAA